MESNLGYLAYLFTVLQSGINEGRLGIAHSDLDLIGQVLQKLELLVREARLRFGLDPGLHASLPFPAAAPPQELASELRLEPPIPKASPARAPRFRPGQIWRKLDGTADFMVCSVAPQSVDIRWCIDGRFERECRFNPSDLMAYASEKQVRINAEQGR